MSERTAVIIGAGKTGRGFAAHLAYNSGYKIVLVDKDQELVARLNNEGKYKVKVLGDSSKDVSIESYKAFHLDDDRWFREFLLADVCFTAVFGNNFEALAPQLTKALEYRHSKNAGSLDIITCENYTNAASFLKENLLNQCEVESLHDYINNKTGFVEAMILRTCLSSKEPNDNLSVLAQDFNILPCNGEGFKYEIPEITGLQPLKGFENQLMRKIYTYNCINAVITYLGAQKGYTQLYEAGADKEIYEIAAQAGHETSEALIKEFGFDKNEQKEWVQAALNKFANRDIPDPISRNGADIKRKLSRGDRLIGPALFCLKHGIIPQAIIKGVVAGFAYSDKGLVLEDQIQKGGMEDVLKNICGLQPDEKLFNLISEQYKQGESH